MGAPVQLPNETYPGERRDITGLLEFARNGCSELEVDGARHFVIWPAGSTLDDRVRLASGEVVREGHTVSGRGAFTPAAPLVGNEDGYWANAIGFCAPDAPEVLVLDTAAVQR